MGKQKNTQVPSVEFLRTALINADEAMPKKGAVTRALNQLEQEIFTKIKAGWTYGQLAGFLRSAGFEVSEHTIAAWAKAKRRGKKVDRVADTKVGNEAKIPSEAGDLKSLSTPLVRVSAPMINPFSK